MTAKYFYFGKSHNGVLMPLFECVADEAPDAKQTNTIYAELVKQQGLGVPRPTHYAKLELIELPQDEDVIEHRNLQVVN